MIRFLSAGESHGPELTAIVEGIPAGLSLNPNDLNHDLARRQKSPGSGGRMKIECDTVTITSGVMAGQTTGAPIALHIQNKDWDNWKDKDIDPLTIPRPGHADLTGTIKYRYGDLRLSLERASARETAARTAVGSLCKHLLNEFGIQVGSYVTSLGNVQANIPKLNYSEIFIKAENDDLRCPDSNASKKMLEALSICMKKQDTLGGQVEVVALHVPPGLGSHVHYDRRLDGILMGLLGSIHAIKGVEVGPAFENSKLYGSEVHDEIALTEDQKSLKRSSNRAGGFEGGITTGEPLVFKIAMKPISTVMKSMASVDLATGQPASTQYERSDFCAVARVVVVAEAMLAFGIAQALSEKLGGDSIEEMQERFHQLKKNSLSDFSMKNKPWKFGDDFNDGQKN